MELSVTEIRQKIYPVRGLQVVLDHDLAEFYQTKTKALNQAVGRNSDRFPADFMIHLTLEEHTRILSSVGAIKKIDNRGGRRNLPYGFTQEGVSMLSGVLNSERAIQVNILVMRAFIQLRQVSDAHLDLVKRFDGFEKSCSMQLKTMMDTIQSLTVTTPTTRITNNVLSVEFDNLENTNIKDGGENKPILKLEAIQNAVIQYYEISHVELQLATRMHSISMPRQVCMYLIRKYLGFSYKHIGAIFGGRDHSTVLHACKKVESETKTSIQVAEAVKSIVSLFQKKNIK